MFRFFGFVIKVYRENYKSHDLCLRFSVQYKNSIIDTMKQVFFVSNVFLKYFDFRE